jgi:hypothetical protein
MSFYVLAFSWISPLGSLSVGALAKSFGPEPVVFGGGCVRLCCPLIFLRGLGGSRKEVRPICIGKGHLSEEADENWRPMSKARQALHQSIDKRLKKMENKGAGTLTRVYHAMMERLRDGHG